MAATHIAVRRIRSLRPAPSGRTAPTRRPATPLHPVRGAATRKPVIPASSPQPAPVILSARPLLTSCPALAEGMRAAGCELLLVASWDRLLQGIEKAVVDVVLVDMDAVERSRAGRQSVSGHRLVALLAQRLAERAKTHPLPSTRLAVLTRLDYAEIEDLARLGIHILARPDHDPEALLTHITGALASHRRAASGAQMAPRADGDDPTTLWRLPTPTWQAFAAALAATLPAPGDPQREGGRRQRIGDRLIMEGLCHMLRMGGSWATYPSACGAVGTARRRLQRWRAAGVFTRLGAQALAGDVASQELLALPWARIVGAVKRSRQPIYEVARPCV